MILPTKLIATGKN